MIGIKQLCFQNHGDQRGNLVALEEGKEIPFSLKRVYYVYGAEGNTRRGFHAHRTLEQVLVCLHGSCKILLDDGTAQETVLLNSPDCGLYVGRYIWHEMYDFSDGAVLMVLASQLYDEGDYIRDYGEFLKLRKE